MGYRAIISIWIQLFCCCCLKIMGMASVTVQLLEDSSSSAVSFQLVIMSNPHLYSLHLKCSQRTGLLSGQTPLWSSSFPQLPRCILLGCWGRILECRLLCIRSQIWTQVGSPACDGNPEVWLPRASTTTLPSNLAQCETHAYVTFTSKWK